MEKLIIIRTVSELQRLQAYLADKDVISFDTETSGIEKESEVIGYSVCAEMDVGYYVITAAWNRDTQQLDYLPTKEATPAFMESLKGKSLIMHNGVFDCWMVENNYRVSLIESLHTDTMIMSHLLDENRKCGLKELAATLYGEESRTEQMEMRESVTANGGQLTKKCYELYKGDANLIARYGAKDAILTFKLFYTLVEQLLEQPDLLKFFYEDESMPLLRGPTYDMNTTGLAIDPKKLMDLQGSLEVECLETMAFVRKETSAYVKDKYPGTGKTNHFNPVANQQLAWLLFDKLDNVFNNVTEAGRDLCKALDLRLPYSNADKRRFIDAVKNAKGQIYEKSKLNTKTGKMTRPKKVGDYWQYLATGKETLGQFARKYAWAQKLLEFKKADKLLKTYVLGIQSRMKYGIIRPNFLQHGTTSGRYSCKNPNFQNLPRGDKRVKACVVARPGKILIGADYAQLEPRVFAYFSGDERLKACFERGEDPYSVVGIPVFGRHGCGLKKSDSNFFGKLHEAERDKSKVIMLAAPYGKQAGSLAPQMGVDVHEAREIIRDYFDGFPSVKKMQLEFHEQAKVYGAVYSMFGRPRRMPLALEIPGLFGKTPHEELDYFWRSVLNLGVNHPIQSTGASIMNRAAIAVWKTSRERWGREVRVISQIHDELILEAPEALRDEVLNLLKECMEETTELPGVALVAEPKAAYNMADLK